MSARWLVVLALVAGCKKQEQAAPVDTDTAPPIPAAELARGKDACTAYVTQVCACATEPAQQACKLAKALPELARAMEERGRDPKSLRIVPFGALPDEGKLAYYEQIGVTETVFRVPTAGRDEVFSVLDKWARLIGK